MLVLEVFKAGKSDRVFGKLFFEGKKDFWRAEIDKWRRGFRFSDNDLNSES